MCLCWCANGRVWLLVLRTDICAGVLMAIVQVVWRLVHMWQDHIFKVAVSSVAMGRKEWCKVHRADVLKARVLQ
jgi:hypothetical protein